MKHLQIETERLLIRAYRENDIQEAYELMQDDDLFKYLPMEVMPFDEYHELFHWLIDCYNVDLQNDWRKYSFVITTKQDGQHVGWCGFGSLDYNHKDTEIFYLIGKSYWGNGYAKEAVRGLIDYCFTYLLIPELVAVVKQDNLPSVKTLEKLGFTYQHVVTGLPDEFNFYNGEWYYTMKNEHSRTVI